MSLYVTLKGANSFNPRSRMGSDLVQFLTIHFVKVGFNPRSRMGSDRLRFRQKR